MLEFSCPKCGERLVFKYLNPGDTGKCRHCGREVLIPSDASYTEEAPTYETTTGNKAAPSVAPAGTKCVNHPSVDAEYLCHICGAAVCVTCDFPVSENVHICPACVSKPGGTGYAMGVVEPLPVPEGTKCAVHTGVDAVNICYVCKAGICETCDFEMPGNVHVCPKCALKTGQTLAGKRKKLLIWSYVLAASALICMVIFFVGAALLAEDEGEAFYTLVGILLFVLPAVGLTLAISSLEKRLGNPASVRIAIIWNAAVLGIYIFLMFVGLCMVE